METIRISVDERGVARLTLARVEKHNALSALMMDELTEAAERLGNDPDVRVVILDQEGKTFCAGGDLAWMREQFEADAATKEAEARRLANMLRALNEMPKPLIGRVGGNAFGGGVGMACVCDVAIAVDTAQFGFTETRLGLIPATIGPYVLARMGEAMARRVFMSARIFDAEEARTLGIVARVVSADELDAAIEAEVVPYLSCATGAVADAKALARALGAKVSSKEIDLSIAALSDRWKSPESTEGIGAFFDKRRPVWQNKAE